MACRAAAQPCVGVHADFGSGLLRQSQRPRRATRSFRGRGYGAEYQGSLDLAQAATLTAGARLQIDTGEAAATIKRPACSSVRCEFDTYSAYGQLELEPLEYLDLTLGGRVDDFENGGTQQARIASRVYGSAVGVALGSARAMDG